MNARQKAKYYKRKYEQIAGMKLPTFKVQTHRIDDLKFTRTYPSALVHCGNTEAILETVKKDLAFSIADKLNDYVEYKADYDARWDEFRICALIRVVRRECNGIDTI